MATVFDPLPDGAKDTGITAELARVWPGFHHEILHEIGRGGNGRVIKVRHTMGYHAVLKYFAPGSALDDAALTVAQRRSLMTQEARVMWSFREHVASVGVMDLAPSGLAYLMEFVNGPTLQMAINEGPADWKACVSAFLPLLGLLADLQEKQLYHRDVTLDNILVDEKGQLKLIDFGYVHDLESPVAPGWADGKDGYKHPHREALNRLESLRHDIQDVYSAVLCLVAWVTGKDPGAIDFSKTTGHEPLDHALRPYLMPDGHLPAYGKGVGSFAALRHDLEKTLEPVVIERSTFVAAPIKKRKRRTRFPLEVVAVLLLAFAVHQWMNGRSFDTTPMGKWIDSLNAKAEEPPTLPVAKDDKPKEQPDQSAWNQAPPPDVKPFHPEEISKEKDNAPPEEPVTQVVENKREEKTQTPTHEEVVPTQANRPKPKPKQQHKQRPGQQVARKQAERIANDLGMKFSLISPGSYRRDAADHPLSPRVSEQSVQLSQQYYLMEEEVTRAQWQRVMGFLPDGLDDCNDCPISRVSWYDAMAFVQKLNTLEDGRYSLPTEAQWEFAARTRDPRLRNLNDGVWEWCTDWYAPFGQERLRDPVGPENGERKVIRGGSDHGTAGIHSESRGNTDPDARSKLLGFRLVRLVKTT